MKLNLIRKGKKDIIQIEGVYSPICRIKKISEFSNNTFTMNFRSIYDLLFKIKTVRVVRGNFLCMRYETKIN